MPYESTQERIVELEAQNGALVAALLLVRRIIVEGAMTGFNPHDGDWAERLYASQGVTFDAVTRAGVNASTETVLGD